MLKRHVPTVAEWMTPPNVVLEPDDDVLHAVELLVRYKVTAGLVVEKGKLLGILGVTDCLRVFSSAAYADEVLSQPVRDAMSKVPMTIEPDMDLFRASEQFLRCHVQTLPVVQDGQLLGRISRHDLLRGFQSFVTEEYRERSKQEKKNEKSTERPRSIEKMQQVAADGGRSELEGRFSRHR